MFLSHINFLLPPSLPLSLKINQILKNKWGLNLRMWLVEMGVILIQGGISKVA